jgi:hypothetical protein
MALRWYESAASGQPWGQSVLGRGLCRRLSVLEQDLEQPYMVQRRCGLDPDGGLSAGQPAHA